MDETIKRRKRRPHVPHFSSPAPRLSRSCDGEIRIERRAFIRLVGAVGLASAAAFRNAVGADKTPPVTQGVAERGGVLIIGNERVEIQIDPPTGCFRDIHNKATGLHHLDGTGSWPFGLSVRASAGQEIADVEISAGSPHPQTMRHSVSNTADGKTLRMEYDNLLTTQGIPTGIRLIVDVALKNDADYYLISARLENNGHYDITNFFSGSGGLIAGESRDAESLAVPTW